MTKQDGSLEVGLGRPCGRVHSLAMVDRLTGGVPVAQRRRSAVGAGGRIIGVTGGGVQGRLEGGIGATGGGVQGGPGGSAQRATVQNSGVSPSIANDAKSPARGCRWDGGIDTRRIIPDPLHYTYRGGVFTDSPPFTHVRIGTRLGNT